MKDIHLYLMNHKLLTYTIIAMIVVFFILISFSKNYRLLVQKLIYKAEIGKLAKSRMYNVIIKLEKSNLDDRMVLVLAELMQRIPILPLIIPKRLLIPILQRSVQRIFNQIKKLLDANSYKKINEFTNVDRDEVIKTVLGSDKDILVEEITKRVEETVKVDLDELSKNLISLIKRKG